MYLTKLLVFSSPGIPQRDSVQYVVTLMVVHAMMAAVNIFSFFKIHNCHRFTAWSCVCLSNIPVLGNFD